MAHDRWILDIGWDLHNLVFFSRHNLVIGQDFPPDQYAATDANFETDQKIPLAWGGYFHGALDEVRMYKTVLSDTQIQSIYDREKPE